MGQIMADRIKVSRSVEFGLRSLGTLGTLGTTRYCSVQVMVLTM